MASAWKGCWQAPRQAVDCSRQLTVHRVILEEVGGALSRAQVVDVHQLKVRVLEEDASYAAPCSAAYSGTGNSASAPGLQAAVCGRAGDAPMRPAPFSPTLIGMLEVCVWCLRGGGSPQCEDQDKRYSSGMRHAEPPLPFVESLPITTLDEKLCSACCACGWCGREKQLAGELDSSPEPPVNLLMVVAPAEVTPCLGLSFYPT